MRKYTSRVMRQFGFGKGASMETFIMDEITEFIQHFDKIRNRNGNIVYIYQIFNIPSLNLLWSLMTGSRIPYDDKLFVELIRGAEEMRDAIKPGVTPYAAFPFLRHIPNLTEHEKIISVHHAMQKIFKV
jgi:hypothetical protein